MELQPLAVTVEMEQRQVFLVQPSPTAEAVVVQPSTEEREVWAVLEAEEMQVRLGQMTLVMRVLLIQVAAAVAVQVMAPALMVSAVQADLELLSSNTQTHLPSSMLTED